MARTVTVGTVLLPAAAQGRVMRLIGFLQAWDLLRDELAREPSLEEYAERFAVALETAVCLDADSKSAFGGLFPGEVLDHFWAWRGSTVKGNGGMLMRR